jgi:hypothetical protein
MASEDRADSPPPPRRRWPIVLGVVAAVVLAVIVCLPLFVDWYATRWLHERGLVDADIEDVDLDLFTGRLGIDGLTLTKEDQRRNRATRTFVDFNWDGLFRERLVIGRIELSDAEITVRRDEARDFFIADFLVAADEREEQVAEDPEEGFDFGILEVDIRNVLVHYRGQFFQEDVLFEELRLGQVATWDPEASTPLSLRARIDERVHSIEGEVRPLAASPGAELALSFDAIELAPFETMLAEAGVAMIDGQFSADAQFNVDAGAEGEATTAEVDGTFSFGNVTLDHTEVNLRKSDLSWDGRVTYQGDDAASELTVAGQFNAGELAVRVPQAAEDVAVDAGDATNDEPAASPAGSAMTLTANALAFEARSLTLATAGDDSTVTADTALELDGIELEQGANRVSLDALRWDGGVDLALGGETPAGNVRGTLAMDTLSAAAPEGRVSATRVSLDDTDIVLAPSGRPDGIIVKTSAGVSELNVADGEDDMSAQVLSLAWTGTADLDLADEGVTGGTDGELQVDGVAAASARESVEAGIGDLRWQGKLSLGAEGVGAGGDSGQIELSSLAVSRIEPRLELAGFDSFAGELTGKEQGGVALAGFAVDGVRLLERQEPAEGEASHVLRIARLQLAGLSTTPERTEIGAVSLSGVAAWVENDTDGLEATQATAGLGEASAGPETEAEAPADTAPAATAATFRIESIETTEPGTLRFIDRSVRPVVDLEMVDLTLAMGALDSASPGTLTPLSFAAAIGDYTKLSYEGELSPLSERMTLYGDGRIESLDMPELAGYQAQAIGYIARSGSLTADLDLKIEQDILNSVAHLKVRQLDLERVVAEEDDEFTADLGVPMDKAVGLLKDDNGLITLDVPIEGDLADLSVGIGDALRTVWAKGLQVAMTHAATTFFAPILPVVAVSKLVGMANKVRFEPVAFARGSAELPADQSAYLKEMADILNSRPDVDVTLCGVATPDELTPAAPATSAEAGATAGNDAGAEAPPPASTAPAAVDESALLALGDTREKVVKDSLVDLGVEAGRLVSCTPAIDSEPDAAPRVEIGV